MRLAGPVTARLVGHLGDGLDEVRLLPGDVEDLAGKRFDPPAQADLRTRPGLQRDLRPLELFELGQLGEQRVGGVTEGLGVSHAG